MFKRQILFKIFICILLLHVTSSMTYLPDVYNPYDRIFLDDISNPTELQDYIMFSYIMGATQYIDQRNGIIYQGVTSLCFEKSKQTVAATYNTGAMASLILTPTSIPLLYDQNCVGSILLATPGLFIPVNFHNDLIAGAGNINYEIIFNLANTSATLNADFRLSLENFNVIPAKTQLNLVTQSMPPKTILSYSVKFTINIVNFQVTYYLQEEAYLIARITPILPAASYFQNGNTATAPNTPYNSYPIILIPNMKFYIDYFITATVGPVNLVSIVMKSCKIFIF